MVRISLFKVLQMHYIIRMCVFSLKPQLSYNTYLTLGHYTTIHLLTTFIFIAPSVLIDFPNIYMTTQYVNCQFSEWFRIVPQLLGDSRQRRRL